MAYRTSMIIQSAFLALLLGTVALAFFRGAHDDRIGAAAFLIAAVASTIADELSGNNIARPEFGVAIVDLALLAPLLWLALCSSRYWPLWAAGFHLVAVLAHIAAFIDPGTVPRAYAVALGLWSFPTVGALTVSLINREMLKRAAIPLLR